MQTPKSFAGEVTLSARENVWPRTACLVVETETCGLTSPLKCLRLYNLKFIIKLIISIVYLTICLLTLGRHARLLGRGLMPPSTHQTGHPIVLVVEDSDSLRQDIHDTLEGAGFLALQASSALEALELAKCCARPIDLLITKVHPTEMPGPDLARLLRRRSPYMSVLYSSGSPLAALEVPDPAEVVSSMLPRPFSREILLRRVNALLAAHA